MSLRESQLKFINKLKKIGSVSNIRIDPKNSTKIYFTWSGKFKLLAAFYSVSKIHMSTVAPHGEVKYFGMRNVSKLSSKQLEKYIIGLLENTVHTYVGK